MYNEGLKLLTHLFKQKNDAGIDIWMIFFLMKFFI